MIFSEKVASEVARSLLQIKAIKLQPTNPFTWASGVKSPIYCDNRKILSYPDIRSYVKSQLAVSINEKFEKPDVIAGVATGGIAHGALVAEEMGLPFVYIRSNVKAHGLNNMIEGELVQGKKVVVVEDLVSTGGSSLKAVDAIRAENCQVLGMTAIFTYGFDIAKENFEKSDCELVTLSHYDILIQEALKENYIEEKDFELLQTWRKNPGWIKLES
ncbi:MAG TPA: orotate phosphoribosyltransferase [Flavobacteriales bacterium]|nr:orotate phosphoribosyltransferase [Flavobacteriales bacterium]HIO67526.1 orotate phosphoribosyltransferase [Flavobacteriales bacterium]